MSSNKTKKMHETKENINKTQIYFIWSIKTIETQARRFCGKSQ